MRYMENPTGVAAASRCSIDSFKRKTSCILFFVFLFAYCPLPTDASPERYQQQTRQISGTVTDENKEPLTGVTVSVKNGSASSQTNADGKFTLNVPNGATHIVFTYVGKAPREVSLGNASIFNVQLQPDEQALETVVISTGYMTQKKADLTGAVSVVTREDFTKSPSANVMRSLQGKVPGVLIGTDGNPAENVGIMIRGITSINSSPPLIVIDGQPVTINLRDINPNDIESIQILKDAASASIYGSRAAGGVILIETRKGKRGETKVMYDGYVGFNKMVNNPKMLDAEGYGRGLWQATVNDGNDPSSIRFYGYDWNFDHNGVPVLNSVIMPTWLDSVNGMRPSNTDWFEAAAKVGIQQNHQITVSGGSEKLRSLFSANYYNNEGTQIYTFFKRLSLRFNNEYSMFGDRLKVGENLTITHLRMRGANENYSSLVMPPNIPVRTETGMWGGVAMNLGMDDFWNPVLNLEVNKDNIPQFVKVLGTVYAELKLLENLSFRSQYGVDYSNWNERNIDHTWKSAGGKSDIISGVSNIQWIDIGQTLTNTLTYKLNKGDHHLDVLGAMETYKFRGEDINVYRGTVLSEDRDYAYLNTATSDRRTLNGFGDGTIRSLVSYFAKANYSFGDKYLLSATIRRDGASVFGKNNRFAMFPAVSAGWRINNENFMKDVDFLSELKLRASWGQNGNSDPMRAHFLVNIYVPDVNGTTYSLSGTPTGAAPNGFRRDRLGNADLQWEATTQTNIGLDFGLFNNRLTGSFDVYQKNTTNMLFEPGYIAAMGEGAFKMYNIGELENKGFELQLNYGGTRRNFSYTISANFSAYENELKSIHPSAEYFRGIGNGTYDKAIGHSINTYYGLVADGIFQNQEEVANHANQTGKGVGRIRYKDLNGDGIISDQHDRTYIGTRDPDLMAGLNIELRYKNFDFTVFLQGYFGNEIYNNWKELSDFWNIGVQNDRNHPYRILDAWTPYNTNTKIPALSRRDQNGEKRLSTIFIENGSFIKGRTIDLGYTLPEKITKKLSMTRMRAYITIQNAFILKKTWGDDQYTGIDPEYREPTNTEAWRYFVPMTGIFGVNVTF
jgi:TonB-linked SusC/RagA family outer membrane protein